MMLRKQNGAVGKTLKVVKDFKTVPIGRKDGLSFREKFLIPAYKSNTITEIDLNGNRLGYGSSFLEEAFGGLVRDTEITFDQYQHLFRITHKHDFYKKLVDEYVAAAIKRR